MQCWPYVVERHTMASIRGCVSNPEWQGFRLKLKGLPTEQKLTQLDSYMKNEYKRSHAAGEIARVCVDNYINALLRGGQLIRTCQGAIVVQR